MGKNIKLQALYTLYFRFYESVENPIDIMKIQQKMKADEYPTMVEFKVNVRILLTGY